MTVSCGLDPATADEVELVTEQVPLFEGPTPSVRALVVEGDTAASVTPTLPAVVTLNVNTIAEFGASEPEKESVEDPLVVPESELLKGLLQAEAPAIAVRSNNV